MSDLWRVEWQHVSAAKYPEFFLNAESIIDAHNVSDEYWTSRHLEGSEEEIRAQQQKLLKLASEQQLVRNVTLWKSPPKHWTDWERVY